MPTSSVVSALQISVNVLSNGIGINLCWIAGKGELMFMVVGLEILKWIAKVSDIGFPSSLEKHYRRGSLT